MLRQERKDKGEVRVIINLYIDTKTMETETVVKMLQNYGLGVYDATELDAYTCPRNRNDHPTLESIETDLEYK